MTWNDYPLRLSMRHMAEISGTTPRTVRKRILAVSPLVPVPHFIHPYGWRRDDVRRWFETQTLVHQRRAVAAQQEGAR